MSSSCRNRYETFVLGRIAVIKTKRKKGNSGVRYVALYSTQGYKCVHGTQKIMTKWDSDRGVG